jgi:hypothetical protein
MLDVIDTFFDSIKFINEHILYLNSSKFFAGVIMILLNVGSKFIAIQFSRSTEEYLKMTVSKQLLVFAMAWMGTRDIYTALGLVAVFTVLSEHLFNEDSCYCIVPQHMRVLTDIIDVDNDGDVSDAEITNAKKVLEKATKDAKRRQQKQVFAQYYEYMPQSNLN